MLEVIAQIGKPMMLPAYREFELGNIVKLVRTPTNVYCSLANSCNSFGMVIGQPDDFNHIPVLYNSASLIRTNLFIPGSYIPGSMVYSNEMGVLTNEKESERSIPIAFVENQEENILEIRWI